MSEPTPSSETSRDVAEEHGPQGRSFSTPAWVPAPRSQSDERPVIPAQPTPAHDDVHALHPAPAGPPLLEHASWSSPRGGRNVLGALMLAAFVGAVVAGVIAGINRSTDTAFLGLFCLLGAAALYAGMAATRPTTTDLDGTRLTVRHGNGVDTFDLADPFQEVLVRGLPESSAWSVALGTPTGGVVVLTARDVDAEDLHPVIMHARQYAERGRAERRARFGR